MATPTITPNIGLQIPSFNQPNWQVPTNYNWNRLDLIFGGAIQVPALNVLNLTATNFTGNIGFNVVPETPSGSVPGSVYTLSQPVNAMLAFCVNGIVQRQGIDYTIAGQVVTLNFTTGSTDTVYAVFLKSTT